MSSESLNRTFVKIENPSQNIEAPQRVNVDVLKQKVNTNTLKRNVNINTLKQRLFEEKKKEKVKRTIIFSSVVASLGVLTFLTY